MKRKAHFNPDNGNAIISMGRFLLIWIGEETYLFANPEEACFSGIVHVDAFNSDTPNQIYEKIKGAYAETTEEQTPTLGTGKEAV